MEKRLAQLEAEVEVLRRYVQALLAFVPRTPQGTAVISQVARDINARAQASKNQASLELALANLNATRHTATYRGDQ